MVYEQSKKIPHSKTVTNWHDDHVSWHKKGQYNLGFRKWN